MECLLFLWWNFALYLACYLHDTLHCNIYMDGTMCMDGTSLCMNNVYGWNWCDMWYETYVLDMCWICAGYETYICDMCCKLWDLIKNRKNRQYAGSLLSATDGKEPLPSAADGKEATWQPTVLPGSWPIWSVCLQLAATWLLCRPRQTAKALCRRWQTAKSLHIVCFFCFLLNPTIFITNIYDIYRYISKGHYRANI